MRCIILQYIALQQYFVHNYTEEEWAQDHQQHLHASRTHTDVPPSTRWIMVVKKLMTLEKMMVSLLNKNMMYFFFSCFCQYLQRNLNNHASKGVLVEQDEWWHSEWLEMAVSLARCHWGRVLRWGCRWHLLHATSRVRWSLVWWSARVITLFQ